jgi:hypothetical protein
MKRTAARLLGALSIFAAAAVTHAQDPSFLDWTIEMSTPKLMSGVNVLLRNLSAGAYLDYTGHNNLGVNLDLRTDISRQPIKPVVRFELANPGKVVPLPGPIAFCQPVAIYVDQGGSGGYIKYSHQRFGVNLDFSKLPSYEWYVVGLASPSEGITRTLKIGLLNMKERGFLIHQNRTGTVDLGWWDFRASLPKNMPAITNPAFRNYHATEPELRQFLDQLARVNPAETAFLKTFFRLK